MAQFNILRHIITDMAKKVPWDILLEILDRFSDGASVEELLLGLSPSISRRTLQRWLSLLVKEGRIQAIGKARARRYQIFREHRGESVLPLHLPIPISREAKEIQSAVSQPLESRQPAVYDRSFLEDYLPNVTYYLSENLRRKLFELGNEDGRYPAGTYARQIFHRLLIDLSWNSSRLEGNTYSLLETEALLERGKEAEGKGMKETQMILNHKAAIEFLINIVKEVGINRYTILNLHTLLSDNLMPDPAACGRLRSIPVGIAKSTYRPLDIPQVIEECFDLILRKANLIEDPFEQSFFLMVQLPLLQPFDDVNKRTSRLSANIPLVRKNLCPLSFIDVPEDIYINGLLGIYEFRRIDLLRDLFAWSYERSCALYSTTRKALGEPDPFRLQYRDAIQQAVRKVILGAMDKMDAIATIREQALHILAKDRSRFIEIVERELNSLHVGNIARYGIRPSEYENWKKSWQ